MGSESNRRQRAVRAATKERSSLFADLFYTIASGAALLIVGWYLQNDSKVAAVLVGIFVIGANCTFVGMQRMSSRSARWAAAPMILAVLFTVLGAAAAVIPIVKGEFT